MSIFPELDARTATGLMEEFPSDQRLFAGVAPEERELWAEEAAVKIAEQARGAGLDFLMREAPQADEARLRAILLALCSAGEDWLARRRNDVKSLLLASLQDTRPQIVAYAIDALNRLGFAETEESIKPLLTHHSPYIVGSVLRFLSRHDPDLARPLLLERLRSPEPIIRQNAVDELDDKGYVEALPQLRLLLHDPDAHVRQAAETAVRHLEELASDRT